MYQILAYFKNSAFGTTNDDIPVVTDPNFSQRNGHWIFTEDYKMQAAAVFGISVTSAQIYDPTYNAINTPQLYPINAAIVPPTNPQVVDMRSWPVGIPKNEEIAYQASNALTTATASQYGLLWIAPAGSSMALPSPTSGVGDFGRVKALFTVTTALTAGLWSADSPITITNLIKGGTYCIAGAYLVADHALAYRINFVRAPLYQGRKLTPGNLVENAYGNIPLALGDTWMGPLGYFDTFELPLMSLLGTTTTGSATYTGYLDLIYMGQNMLSNQPLTA